MQRRSHRLPPPFYSHIKHTIVLFLTPWIFDGISRIQKDHILRLGKNIQTEQVYMFTMGHSLYQGSNEFLEDQRYTFQAPLPYHL